MSRLTGRPGQLFSPAIAARGLRGAAVGLAAVCSSVAWAGVADVITVTLAPVPDEVTYSVTSSDPGTSPLNMSVAYRFTAVNDGTNNTNFINLTGWIWTSNGSQETIDLDNENNVAAGLNCSLAPGITPPTGVVTPTGVIGKDLGAAIPAGATVFSCENAFRNLKGGTGPASVTVYFKSPVRVVGNGKVSVTGYSDYSERTNDTNSTNDRTFWTLSNESVALGTVTTTRIKSALPPKRGIYFTGQGGVPTVPGTKYDPSLTNADAFASLVGVPDAVASSNYTTVEIVETGGGVGDARGTAENVTGFGAIACNNFTYCFKSDITIPSATFSPFASFILRQDALTLGPGFKVRDLKIFYTDNEGTTTDLTPSGAPGSSGSAYTCAVDEGGNPVARADGLPCIVLNSCKVWKRGDAGLLPGLLGDLECTLINRKNGTFRLR